MGLPKITSMDDGADGFSEPLPDLDVPTPLPSIGRADPRPAEDRELREFEEFQRWKKMREAQTAEDTQTPAAPRATTRTRPKQKKPSIVDVATAPTRATMAEQELPHFPDSTTGTGGSTDGLRQRVDPKTGVSYYEIPKTKMGDDGRPVLAMDLDIDDLNGEAKNFLGHLQVAPSKEEQEEILRKRSELIREQRAKREELDRELNAKEGNLEEPETDPFNEKPTKKRGLFGRKS